MICDQRFGGKNPLAQSLAREYRLALELLRNIACFSDEQWLAGFSSFEVPGKLAFHTIDCLDKAAKRWIRTRANAARRRVQSRSGKSA